MSDSRLSGIETQWSLIHNANEPGGKGAMARVVDRYGPAVKRYLLAALRSEEAADEVFQEFALRLIRGDFRNADEHKGRFRSLMKTALHHLIVDWYRGQQRRQRVASTSGMDELAMELGDRPGEPFSVVWRESLLNAAWTRLLQLQQQSGTPYHRVLKLRADHPELATHRLQELAESEGLETQSASAFRVLLHRGRRLFAELLREQVRDSIESPSDEDLELELIELGLHHYCKPRRRS